MKLKVSQIIPNPFRRLDEYPIDEAKIAALITSFRKTGFWGNVLGRKTGEFIEIAYGHHRLEAIRRVYDESDEVEIIVKPLTNEQMIQIMAAENMEEWGTNAWVEVETLETTLQALANGAIKALPKLPATTHEVCIAPSVLRADQDRIDDTILPKAAYSRRQIAEFLGWTAVDGHHGFQPSAGCKAAFAALEAMERKLLSPKDLKGLSRHKLLEVCNNTIQLHKSALKAAADERKIAKVDTKKNGAAHRENTAQLDEQFARSRPTAIAKALAKDLREDKKTMKQARAEFASEGMRFRTSRERVVKVDEIGERLAARIGNIANGDDALSESFKLLRDNRKDLSDRTVRLIAAAITQLHRRLSKEASFAKELINE